VIRNKRFLLVLCILLALSLGIIPEAMGADKALDPADTNRIGFMFAVIGDYMQDGGSDVITRFDEATRASDDFYGGVMFFYAFNAWLAQEALGNNAITPDLNEDEWLYVFEAQHMNTLFYSFFGDAFLPQMHSILSDYQFGENRYGFPMSDGPTPLAAILSGEYLTDGKVKAQIAVVMDGEEGKQPVGIFDATLSQSDDSIFGYTIDQFVFQPA